MEFVDTFDQLRNIAQIARKCPTQTLKRAFLRSMRDLCNESRWLRKTLTMSTSDTQSGIESTYLIPLVEDEDAQYVEVIGIRDHIVGIDTSDNPNREFKIMPGDPQRWDLTVLPRQPREYAYKPEGMFDIWPTPDIPFNMRLTVQLQNQDDAAKVPRDILKKWSTEIEAGALSYLLDIPGQPWSNPSRALMYAKQFQAGINNAKADAQRSYNTGSQRVVARRFIRL